AVTTLLASAALLCAVGGATPAGCRRSTERATPHARDPSLVPRLGAHALVVHDQNKGVTPATTAPIATRARDSVFLAVSMGRTVNFVAPTDSYDNRWSLIGRRNPYANGPFYTAVWSAIDARGGPGHTLSQTKSSDPADEISLAFVEVVNAGAIGDAAYAYPK